LINNNKNNSNYHLGNREAFLDLVPGLMSPEYVEGRLDAKNKLQANATQSNKTRPGYSWVDDPRVKGGGYWRKLPKGGAGGAIATGIVAAAALGAGAYAASRLRKQPTETPSPAPSPPEKAVGKKIGDGAFERLGNHRRQPLNKTIIGAGIGGAAAGSIATAIFAARLRDKAVAETQSDANKNLQDTIATHAKDQKKMEEEHAARVRSYETTIGDLHAQKSNLETRVGELSSLIERSKATQAESVSRTQALSKELDTTKATLAKTQAQLEETTKTSNRQISELDRAKTELEGRVKSLSDEMEGHKRAGEEQSERAKSLTQELETHKQSLAATQSQLQEATARRENDVNTLTQQRTELEGRIGALEEEISREKATSASIGQEAEQISQRLAEREQQLKAARQEWEDVSSRLSETISNRDRYINERVEGDRARIMQEAQNAIDEGDRRATARATEQIQQAQKQFEERLTAKEIELSEARARANDPIPLNSQQANRGDLVDYDKGISFGASHRSSSSFFSKTEAEQQTTISNKSDRLIEDLHGKQLKALASEFNGQLKEINRETPSPLATGAQLKSPSDRIATIAKFLNKSPQQIERELGGAESKQDRQVMLHRLAALEKLVVKQQLREEVLHYIKENIGTRAKEQYFEAISQFRNAASTDGQYSPSQITPKALDKLDESARKIYGSTTKDFNKATAFIIHPDFGKQLDNIVANYLEGMPTETTVRRSIAGESRNISLELAREISNRILQRRGDSTQYQAGSLEAKSMIKKTAPTKSTQQRMLTKSKQAPDVQSGVPSTPAQKEKFRAVMREFTERKLHIGNSKKLVKSREQAIAIALSEARKQK
jgi:hypothetical protein